MMTTGETFDIFGEGEAIAGGTSRETTPSASETTDAVLRRAVMRAAEARMQPMTIRYDDLDVEGKAIADNLVDHWLSKNEDIAAAFAAVVEAESANATPAVAAKALAFVDSVNSYNDATIAAMVKAANFGMPCGIDYAAAEATQFAATYTGRPNRKQRRQWRRRRGIGYTRRTRN